MKNITVDNFQQEVMESSQPVLLDFWATWCGPCKMLSPIVEELETENEGKVKFGKINIDMQPDLAMQYEIYSIPTLVLFKDGKVAGTSVGYVPKATIEALLAKI